MLVGIRVLLYARVLQLDFAATNTGLLAMVNRVIYLLSRLMKQLILHGFHNKFVRRRLVWDFL